MFYTIQFYVIWGPVYAVGTDNRLAPTPAITKFPNSYYKTYVPCNQYLSILLEKRGNHVSQNGPFNKRMY